MEILRKKEFEEDRLFQNFHEMILYHMRQMQQCLTTAGKMFCDHNDEEETCEKRGRDVVESVIFIHARMDRILSRKQIRFMNGNYFCVQ